MQKNQSYLTKEIKQNVVTKEITSEEMKFLNTYISQFESLSK